MKKCLIVFISIAIILSTQLVSALEKTDPENDVDHIIQNPYSIEPVSSKPNLDVKKVSYTVDEGVATLSITVKGEIEDNELITYYCEYEGSDALYQFTYKNGNLNSKTDDTFGTAQDHTIDPPNTLTVTFDVVGAGGSDGELYGFAGDNFPNLDGNEYWMDNTVVEAGGTPGGGEETTDGGNTDGSGTPGFETILVVAALGIAFVILRRKK